MKNRGWLVVSVGMAVVVLMGVGAGAEESGHRVVDLGDDVHLPIGDPADALAPQASDPLDLLVGIDTLRDHSLGLDVLDVWACGVSDSTASLAAELNDTVGAYFEHHSRGWYIPRFVARGSAGGDYSDCQAYSYGNATPEANGAIHVTPQAGGFASPGSTCGFAPCGGSEYYRDGNNRVGFVGNQQAFNSTAAHEMGHMLQWPHSYTGLREDSWRAYDNALDLMSGNYGLYGQGYYGSHPDPYAAAVINLYAAGWITPEEVYVFSGNGHRIDLATAGGTGFRMAVVQAGRRFYTLGARIPSTYDPIPDHWSGVEVYEVEACRMDELSCLFAEEMLPGFRRVKPHPTESFDFSDRDSYDEPLAHVIRPGTSREIGGVTVEVGDLSGQSLTVSIGSDPQPLANPAPPSRPREATQFHDTSGHGFSEDVEWLANSEITKGCTPPVNARFCPDDPVTRGQMAAFLHRALPDLAAGSATDFSDDNGSVFEADIEWLASVGVTRGCNPPANHRFCPDQIVTRAQMAAFLHRALPDLATGDATDFSDDNGDVFEADIEWLAASGVTKGCNPPANDRFCPTDPVTRGAMAAFLHRALDG